MKTLLATASLLALAAPAAQAQQVFQLDPIVVSPTIAGEATDLDRTGATVEVVTAEDLATAPEASPAETLARLPGISVSANGGLGTNTTLRIRGLDGSYIKVLVDGIDVTDPSSTQTQFNWGNLTTSSIERIEVLKGSASSIYGAGAVGGVVSITTAQRPEEPGTAVTVSAEGGSFDTWRGSAAIGHSGERGGLSFNINRVTTRGFSARAGAANTEPDGFDATQLSFSADIMATDRLKLGLTGFALDAEGDFDEFGGDGAPPYDEFNITRTRALRGFAELETGAVLHKFSASYYENDRISSSNGFDTPFFGDRRRVDYIGTYAHSEALTLSFGADYQKEGFNSGTDTGDTTTAAVFAEALYAPSDRLDLAASLRYDDHSSFGGQTTGRLAAAWRASDATILRAVAATGFRAPSLYELNSTLYGNPTLQPEESTSFELGVEQIFGDRAFVKATAFYTEIENLIQFVTLTSWPLPFTGQYQQVPGTSTSKGVELSGQWQVSEWLTLFGNYTYTDATDATGARLLRVPGHDAVLGFDASLAPAWNATMNLRHVADRPDEFGTVMEDYTVVDAALFYTINDNAEAYLRVENLFDADYQTSANYNASGRAFFAGLRATF